MLFGIPPLPGFAARRDFPFAGMPGRGIIPPEAVRDSTQHECGTGMEKKTMNSNEEGKTIGVGKAGSPIRDRAYRGRGDIVVVEIRAGVTAIGKRAFAECENLREIHIPDSVEEIGDEAFRGCISLAAIDIPGSVKKIGEGVFSECSSLKSLTIPDGVTEIGASTFGVRELPQTEGNLEILSEVAGVRRKRHSGGIHETREPGDEHAAGDGGIRGPSGRLLREEPTGKDQSGNHGLKQSHGALKDSSTVFPATKPGA